MATKEIIKNDAVVDEWDEKRTVRLPKAHDGEDKSLYVAVNGRSFMVPKGVTVEVPLPVYERIMIMLEAEDRIQDYRDEIPNDA